MTSRLMFLDIGEAEARAPRRAAAVKSLFCIVMIVEEMCCEKVKVLMSLKNEAGYEGWK